MGRFLAKLLIFLLALLGAQAAIAAAYPFPISPEVLHFQRLLDDGVDVIYLGDSTLWHPLGSQTTAEMLQERLPSQTVGELSHAAYSMDLYLAYVEYMIRQGYEPDLVIIPINMRSFSPEWDLRPGYQFVEEKRTLRYGLALTRLFGRPINVLGGFDAGITQDTFLNSTVFSGTVAVGQVQDFEFATGRVPLEEQTSEQFVYYQEPIEDAELVDLLTYYYMYSLQPDHRKVEAMLQIVELLRPTGTQPLFYFTPINVELGSVYLDGAFEQQFARNVALVRELLTAQHAPLLDLSTDLEAFYFSDTEHLRQNGKQYVAQQLASQIRPDDVAPEGADTFVQASPTAATAPESSTPTATLAPPADNPLLATAMARAATAGAPTIDTPVAAETPVPTPANPLLATAMARATVAHESGTFSAAETPPASE